MSDTTMFVVVYSPETGEEYLNRELEPDEIMDASKFANEIADMLDVEIDDSDGFIPNCCGDIRVEFRPDPDNPTHIWTGQSFYFAKD